MNRIVVVFGTFNPLTKAHIQIGKLAQEKVQADKVIYVPARDEFLVDWKKMVGSAILNAQTRIMLMKKAFIPYGFVVSELETANKSDGKTYSSLNLLKQQYLNSKFYLVMGADKIEELDRWYNAQQLISQNRFLIVNRNEMSLSDVLNKSPLASRYAANFTAIVNEQYVHLSSTVIRDACAHKKLVEYQDLLPEIVYQYLFERQGIFTKGEKND